MCWQALERMISDVEANQSQVLDGVSGTVTHACIYACMHVIFTLFLRHGIETNIYFQCI
jgi:hypothetical protein